MRPSPRFLILIALPILTAHAQTGATLGGQLLGLEENPITCAAIILTGAGIDQRMTVTDNDGRYLINNPRLPAGAYVLEIFSPALLTPDSPEPQAKGPAIVEPFTITNEQAQDNAEITFDFTNLAFREEPQPKTIRATLQTSSGNGIPVTEVVARDSNCAILDFTYTCANGNFEVVLPVDATTTRLEFSGAVLESARTVNLASGDLTNAGEITATPIDAFTPPAVRFIVTDAVTGDPVPMTHIMGRRTSHTFNTTTNCTGVADVDGLQSGGYTLTVNAPGYIGRFSAVTAAGATLATHTITLQPEDPDADPTGGRCGQSMGPGGATAWNIADALALLVTLAALALVSRRRPANH